MNVAADTRGHFAGVFAFLAHLHPVQLQMVLQVKVDLQISQKFL